MGVSASDLAIVLNLRLPLAIAAPTGCLPYPLVLPTYLL